MRWKQCFQQLSNFREITDFMKNVAEKVVSYKKEYLWILTSFEVSFFSSVTDTARILSESGKGFTES